MRAPDTVSRIPVFKTGAFNHSAISPRGYYSFTTVPNFTWGIPPDIPLCLQLTTPHQPSGHIGFQDLRPGNQSNFIDRAGNWHAALIGIFHLILHSRYTKVYQYLFAI